MSVIAEEPIPLIHPYQYIPPDYIQAVTADGQPLIARSIIQSADGILHVQMEVAPQVSQHESEFFFAHGRQYESPMTSPLVRVLDVSDSYIADGKVEELVERRDSVTSLVSHDGGSERNNWEVCATSTDEGSDVDAEGEVVVDGYWDNIDGERSEIEAAGGEEYDVVAEYCEIDEEPCQVEDVFANVDFETQVEIMRQMAAIRRRL